VGSRKRNLKDHQSRNSGRGNPKYRLNEQEANLIREYRRIQQEAESAGLNPKDVHSGWIKSKEASIYFKNPNFKEAHLKEFKQQLLKDLKEYSPSFDKIIKPKVKDGHCLLISPADIHIGKLCKSFVSGEEYNKQIAVQRTLEAIDGILQKSNGFNIDKLVLCIGNDVMHIDTPSGGKTTRGTVQDVDGMFFEHFHIAKRLYINIIETLVSFYPDLHIVYNSSNHDYLTGFCLADTIATYFRNSKNITFDISLHHRKYYTYYDNLIGSTHGDGAKWDLLPLLMADESRDWSDTKYRYMFTHHVHHKISNKDLIGCSVESFRSPSPSDTWHSKMGFTSSNNQAIEGFIFSKHNGQVSRISHFF
tara:strand:+ start:1828 stop:2913 length:1086 start_codon:yes stop_codon:yes gene_type:complete